MAGFLFFRQTTDLIVYVPLFTDFTRSPVLVSSLYFTRFTVNPAVTGSSPCFSQKLSSIFSALCDCFNFIRHCATFFRFFLPSKSPTLKLFFFDILKQTKVPKSLKGLPFYVFRHYETVRNSHFSFFFENKKNWKICLSPKGLPFNLFDILQQTGFSKSPKGPPFTGLKTLRFLSLRYSADFRRSRLVCFLSVAYKTGRD